MRRVFAARPDLSPARLVAWDLCCGKSLTSILLKATYPTLRVIAVDRIPAQIMPHKRPDVAQYHQADLFSDAFEAHVRETLAAMPGSAGLLCGMHRCGALSTRAIELYARVPGVVAIVLSPCCLPSKVISSVARDSGTKDPLGQYRFWGEHLRALVAAVPGTPAVGYQVGLGGG